MKPAIQFLELIVENPNDIFKDYIIKEKNRQKGMKPICALLNNSDSDNNDNTDIINMDDLIDFSNFQDNVELDNNCKTRKKKGKKKQITNNDSDSDNLFYVGL